MNRFNSNLAFIDLLFILLIGFTLMLIMAVLYINPVAQKGKIDPVAKLIVTLRWDDYSVIDMDLWVRGPVGQAVGYSNKDGRYIVLDRDDLGRNNDTYVVNGQRKLVKKNMELVTINDLPDGEYVVNLHNYSWKYSNPFGERTEKDEVIPVPAKVELVQMHPFKVLYSGTRKLDYRQEVTVITFNVVDGQVVDIRTDLDIPLYYDGRIDLRPPSFGVPR